MLSEDAAAAGDDGPPHRDPRRTRRVPAQARMQQRATYALRAFPAARFVLPSTVVLDFDRDQRVVRHEDRWFGRAVTYNAAHRLLKEWHGLAFGLMFV